VTVIALHDIPATQTGVPPTDVVRHQIEAGQSLLTDSALYEILVTRNAMGDGDAVGVLSHTATPIESGLA
jgi:hypothetical protein